MANFTFFFFTIIFIFSFTSLFLNSKAYTKCSNGGPVVRFPFHIKGQREPQHPKNHTANFQLLCKQNTTTIHFPSYGDLAVRSISYGTKRLDLSDPKSCVHEVFLNLNLSSTPFSYYYLVKDYTYINCSAKLSSGFAEIPCLSDYGHYVYTVEPSMDVPNSCKPIKTVAIPFKYSPYLSDGSFGLGLTWGFLGDQDCDGKQGPCDLLNENIGGFRVGLVKVLKSIRFLVFAGTVAILAFKTIYYMKEPVCQSELGNNKNQVENEKYLGDYQAFASDEAHQHKVAIAVEVSCIDR